MTQDDGAAALFRQSVRYWNDGDFAGVLSLLSENIVHTVNVDALHIPWMSSAEGKDEVSFRLSLIRETFAIDSFAIEAIVSEGREARATVYAKHTHKKTGERLEARLRFVVRVENGLIVRLNETVDGAYFEAFERFVGYLGKTAEELGNTPPEPFLS